METAVPYAYLNDYVDTIEAMPSEVVRHFSRLEEVYAQGVGKMESFASQVIDFMNILDTEAAARNTTDTTALERLKAPEYMSKRTALLEGILSTAQENITFIREKTAVASAACDTAKRLVEKLNDNLQHFEDEQENTWRITQGAYGESLQMAAAAQLNGARNEMPEVYNPAPAAATLTSKARANTNDISKSSKKVDATPSKKRKNGNGKESPPPGRAGTPNHRKEKVSTAVAPSKPNPAALNGSVNASVSLKRKESSNSARGKGDSTSDVNVDPNEPTYCYCNQVSYGEMVACDNDSCPREWFHLPCVGLTAPPKGKWYCKECAATVKRRR